MSIAEKPPRKISKYGSTLIFRISLVYLGLTMVNLLFFWVASGARQMRLITEKSLSESEISAERLARVFEPVLNTSLFSAYGQKSPVENRTLGLTTEKTAKLFNQTEFARAGITFTIIHESGAQLNKPGLPTANPSSVQLLFKAMQKKEQKNAVYVLDPDAEKNMLRILMPLHWSGDSAAGLLVETGLPGVQAEINSLYRFAVLLIVVVFLIQAIFGVYLYKTVLKPIRKLGDGARAVSEGHYMTFIMPPRYKDEIRELTERFNLMTSSLAEKTEQLQATIKVLRQRDTKNQLELNLAQSIQTGLIPSPEQALPAFRVTVAYKPLQTVSGDYYDFFTLPSGAQGILIADASGHGVPAAFVTLMASVFFEDAVLKSENPAEVFAEVNQEIERAITTPDYLTAFYLVRQPDGKIAYCNGCHRPALVQKKKTGELVQLTTDGFFLGSMYPPPYDYEVKYDTLETGDRIFLYTDGITEAENIDKVAFGEDRLIALLEAGKNQDIETLKDAIVKEVEAYAEERRLFDDYTLIIAEVN